MTRLFPSFSIFRRSGQTAHDVILEFGRRGLFCSKHIYVKISDCVFLGIDVTIRPSKAEVCDKQTRCARSQHVYRPTPRGVGNGVARDSGQRQVNLFAASWARTYVAV